MDFRVLGPLEVRGERGAVNLGGPKPRAVLAVLLLHANEPVSSDRLVEAVWGEEESYENRKSLQVSVSRLRKALGEPGVVATKGRSYEVRVRPGELDAERFERLVDDGRHALAAGDPERAAATLREGLALWRGPALADLAVESFAETDIGRLEEQRLAALETRVDADLAAGEHDALVGELRQLVADNPTRERLAGQLMLALYRCGRQVEALEEYRRARERLVEEIGVEPGPELRRLHEAILRQDPSLEPPSPRPELPRELDAAAAPRLVGRDAELAWLRERWARAQRGSGSFVTVTGAQGSGRTRLAAELAGDVHRHGATVLYAAGTGPVDATLAAVTGARDATGATLLVVDEADRAGEDVADKLADLARVLPTTPVLALATGERPGAFMSLDADGAIELGPLDAQAVREMAAPYASDPERDEVPVDWLLETSGGLPLRVHELASQWARHEASRRVDEIAERTESGRAELRSMENELAGGVVQLQRADERLAQVGDQERPVVCPFKGLAPFDVDDADYFFGRERLVADLVARLVGTSLLGVVGPSGSGKSSLVRAGLLPALAGGVLPGSDKCKQVVIRPGEHPLGEIRRALGRVDLDEKVVLAVDQFEETFTACRDEEERATFISELVAVSQRDAGAVVVVALRADFYGRCAAYPELSRLLAENHVLVGAMQHIELRRAVLGPAERVGLHVEPELVEALVNDVEDEPGELPLLSSALLELWQRRDGRHLRLSTYEHTGGVRGAVARLAEDGFGRLDAAQQAVARTVFLRLAEVEIEGGVERRRLPREEVEDGRGDVAAVVDLLADARLLTVSAGSVEFAHEALLREWPRLRDWIEADRENLRIHRNLCSAAEEWQRLGRDEGALYRGSRLAEARDWAKDTYLRPTDLEKEFLGASLARQRRERGARRRRLRFAFGGLAAALAAITAVAIVALYQGREAERQRDTAASRELAARATNFLDVDPGLSLALALQALERRDTEQAKNVLRQATLASSALSVWPAHDGWVHAVEPSGDGRQVVTGGRDGAVRIWDLDSGRVVSSVKAHKGWVYGAGFSPDGQQVASAGDDGTVVVWDVEAKQKRVVADFGLEDATGAAFSPDGGRLILPRLDGTVHVLPVTGDDPVTVLRGHKGLVWGADFSPDGTEAVSAGSDGSARIWDLSTGASTVLRHPDAVMGADFSPDGRLVATAGGDGIVRVWNASGSGRPVLIRVDAQPVNSVRFSGDGRRLVTAGDDGIVRVWDARGGPPLAEFKGHRGLVVAAAFVPATDTVVSGGEDGTLRRWAAPADAAIMEAPVTGASFGPDDGRVLSGGLDGAVRIWDTSTGSVRVLRGHEQTSHAQFTPGGDQLVSTSEDGTVRVWDSMGGRSKVVYSGREKLLTVAVDPARDRIAFGGDRRRIVILRLDDGTRVVLRGHRDVVRDVAFSPDGRQIVSGSGDGTVRLWNSASGKLERTLRGHRQSVDSVAYSPDGERVVSAGADAALRIWSVDGGRPVILRGHEGGVSSAEFAPDGERVTSTGQDGTVRVWSAAGGETLVVLYRYDGPAHTAQFSSDGRRVVSAGDPGIIRVSSCEVCGPIRSVLRLARTRLERELSASERQRLLPGRE